MITAGFVGAPGESDFLCDKPFPWLTTKNVGWIPKDGRTYGEIVWQDVYLTQ